VLLSFRNLPISHFRIAAARPIVIAVPNVPSAAAFFVDTPPEFDKIFPRGISANGKSRSD
jgi:hypothetical protein